MAYFEICTRCGENGQVCSLIWVRYGMRRVCGRQFFESGSTFRPAKIGAVAPGIRLEFDDEALYSAWRTLMTRMPSSNLKWGVPLLLFLAFVLPASFATGQRRRNPVRTGHNNVLLQRTAWSRPPRVAVLPFFNALSDAETAPLSEGILDSLAGALECVNGLAVVDPAVAADVAQQSSIQDTRKESDAVKLGSLMSADVVVMGSYQRVGDRFRIEARLLDVRTGHVLSGATIRGAGTYPNDYFPQLDTVCKGVVAAMSVSPSATERSRMTAESRATGSIVAHKKYAEGTQRMKSHTSDDLLAAVELFRQALNIDPNYAEALAAISHAESLLATMTTESGGDATQTRQTAREQAEAAGKLRPRSGRIQRQLAHARSADGDFDGAVAAASEAVRAWPGDALSRMELSRARGRGEVAPGPDLDAALRLAPWLVKVQKDLPTVVVINRVEVPLQVLIGSVQRSVPPMQSIALPITPGSHAYQVSAGPAVMSGEREFTYSEEWTIEGNMFPRTLLSINNQTSSTLVTRIGDHALSIGPNGSGKMTFRTGKYPYQIRAGEFVAGGIRSFEAGEQVWTLTDEDIPRGQITITNVGNVGLAVNVIGSTSRSFYLAPAKSRTVTVSPGNYKVRGSYGGHVTGDDEWHVDRESKTQIELGFKVSHVYR